MAEFKIAEGFVEVDADINQASIRAKAILAGTTAGAAFGKSFNAASNATADRDRDGFWRRMFTPSPSIVRAMRTGIPDALGSPMAASGVALGVTFAASFIGAVITSGLFMLLQGGFIGLAAFAVRKNEELAASYKALGIQISNDLEKSAEPMVPAFADAADRIGDMFPSKIGGPLKKIFEGVAPTVAPLAEGLVEMVHRILEPMTTPKFLAGFQTVTGALASELPRLGDAFGALFTNLADDADDIAEGFGNVITVTGGLIGFIGDLSIALTDLFNNFADVGNFFGKLGDASTDVFNKAGGDAEGFMGVLMDMGDMVKNMVGIGMVNDFLKWSGVIDDTSDSTGKMAKKVKRAGGDIKNTATTMREDAAGAAATLKMRLDRLAKAAEDAQKEAKRLRDTLFETAQSALSLDEASDDLKDAIDGAKDAADDHEKVSRDERRALRGVAEASHTLIGKMIDQGKSTDSIVGKTKSAREQFIKVAEKMGYTSGQAKRLADRYGLIPSKVKTQVEMIRYQQTMERISNIRAGIASIKGKKVNITITETRRINTHFATYGTQGYGGQNAHGGIIGAERGMQTGGISGARSRILVGERRPEVVELPIGSRVIPSMDQARDRGQSWGGDGFNQPTEIRVVLEAKPGANEAVVELLRHIGRATGTVIVSDGPTT